MVGQCEQVDAVRSVALPQRPEGAVVPGGPSERGFVAHRDQQVGQPGRDELRWQVRMQVSRGKPTTCRDFGQVIDLRAERRWQLVHRGEPAVQVHLHGELACRDHLPQRRPHPSLRHHHERGPERRMAREREFRVRREDPHRVPVIVVDRDERCLREADLTSQRLHGRSVERSRLGDDAQLVPCQRALAEHVHKAERDLGTGRARPAVHAGQRIASPAPRPVATVVSMEGRPDRRYRDGARAVAPLAVAVLGFGISFGLLARSAGMSWLAPIVMSATTFAGSAQFAAVSILGAGGTVSAAVTAAVLLNLRYGPIGVSVAPWLDGPAWWRFLRAQLVVDESWAVAAEGEGRFDPRILVGAGLLLYLAWVAGTAIGAVGGQALGDPKTLGLDAAFPALFLALLLPQLRNRRAILAAVLGGAIALALIPEALASGQSISLDARLVGMGAAGIALWRRAPILVVIVVAAAATALTRLLG